MGTRLVQLRVPEEILRRIDAYVREGMYRSRSEVILDATRRFLQRASPTTPLELFIEKYAAGKIEPSKEATQIIDKLFTSLAADARWKERFGKKPEEIMGMLRSRVG